ncbi:cytochrome P450 [Embleya sp. AB8]|uniref:cytochrome P450 n=1 Tax=Embleya sp. AB8 TaxID=3156304 RepID=UPI003C791671
MGDATIAGRARAVPTVRGWPLLGSAVPLVRDPLGFFGSLRSRGPVVTIRIGPQTMYVVNDPALVRQVLVDQAHSFDKGRQYDKLRPWWGNGLANSEGDFHRRQRRLMQPAFHRRQIAAYVPAMREVAEERIGAWPSGRTIALDEELYALTLSMVLRNLFAVAVEERHLATLQAALPVILDGVLWRCLDTTELLEKLPLPANRRFAAALADMHTTVDTVIARHAGGGADLLTMLREARDPDTGEAMSPQQVHDEVITVLMTGAETTRSTLSWVCHELGRHPEMQRRVQAEVDDVLAGQPVQADQLDRLPYTRSVITETLRAYPVVWLLTRRALTDVRLGPFRIPAGAAVCYVPHAVQHDPAWYPDPDRFDPDRFSTGQTSPAGCPASRRPRDTFVAFGAGIHSCIGEPLAWAQAITILATLAQRWTLTPAPHTRVRPAARMLLLPDHLPLVLHPRHTTTH